MTFGRVASDYGSGFNCWKSANKQNEITSVSGATTPTYDNNGNLTKDENNFRFVYDAWNRQVIIKNATDAVITTNTFNGINQNVKVVAGSSTIDRIFSDGWQLVEEKSGSNTVTRNVLSPIYVDAFVLRDRDTDANGTLDERLFVTQDANYNVTAITNTSGTVQERYTYTPFGLVTYRDASGSAISSSTKAWVFLHQGGQINIAGDYDFRNRVLSPTLGRWLTKDPSGFRAGDANLYRYLGNNPGIDLDPYGLEDLLETIKKYKAMFPTSPDLLPPKANDDFWKWYNDISKLFPVTPVLPPSDDELVPTPGQPSILPAPGRSTIQLPFLMGGSIIADPGDMKIGITTPLPFDMNWGASIGKGGDWGVGASLRLPWGTFTGSTGSKGPSFGLLTQLPGGTQFNIGNGPNGWDVGAGSSLPGDIGKWSAAYGKNGWNAGGNMELPWGQNLFGSTGSKGSTWGVVTPHPFGSIISGHAPNGWTVGAGFEIIPGINFSFLKGPDGKWLFLNGEIPLR